MICNKGDIRRKSVPQLEWNFPGISSLGGHIKTRRISWDTGFTFNLGTRQLGQKSSLYITETTEYFDKIQNNRCSEDR